MSKVLISRISNSTYFKELNKGLIKSNYLPNSKVYLSLKINDSNNSFITGLSESDEEYFEKNLNLEKGKLNKFSDYWKQFELVIEDGGIILDTSKILDELRYKTIVKTNNVLIAMSESELKEKPAAILLVKNDDEEIELRTKVREVKDKAVKLRFNMTEEDKHNYLALKRIDPKSLSQNKINDLISTDSEKNPLNFIKILTDKNILQKVFINKCLDKEIIKIKSGHYYFYDDIIGSDADLDTVVQFLNESKNKNVLIQLKKLVEE